MNSALSCSRVESQSSWSFCHEILPQVSRTFALTIPVLSGPLADSVCVAYLLCRIADTIEDRNDLELQHRLWVYREFAEMVAEPPSTAERVGGFLKRWPADADPAYQRLVEHLGDVLSAYASVEPSHRAPINTCVQEMIQGMSAMTHRPPVDGVVYVCADLPELERYCHYVAGVVGLMLTRLFDAQLQDAGAEGFATEERLEQGRRFGLGLQLTNILKDHRVDLERGTSFIPRGWFSAELGLLPGPRAELVERTLAHLETAHAYTLAIPAEQEGLRLFCLWAGWMAVGTLREVARATDRHPKIARDEVAEILAFTRAHVRDDEALQQRFDRLREQLREQLDTLRG